LITKHNGDAEPYDYFNVLVKYTERAKSKVYKTAGLLLCQLQLTKLQANIPSMDNQISEMHCPDLMCTAPYYDSRNAHTHCHLIHFLLKCKFNVRIKNTQQQEMKFSTSSITGHIFLSTHTAHNNLIFLSTQCDSVYTVLCTDIANKNVLLFIVSDYI